MTRIDEQINDQLDLFNIMYVTNNPPVTIKRAVQIALHAPIIHRAIQITGKDYSELVITACTVNDH